MLIGSLHLRFEQLVNAAKPIDRSWYKKRNVSFWCIQFLKEVLKGIWRIVNKFLPTESFQYKM